MHSTVWRSTLRLPLTPMVKADLLLRIEAELPKQMRFIAWRVDDEDDSDGSALERFEGVATGPELDEALGLAGDKLVAVVFVAARVIFSIQR